jgi:O-antigen ligase
VADQGPAGSVANRFTDVGLNGRLQQWRIAADAFREHPLTGLGAENYEAYFLQHRETDLVVRQAHSRPMELLAELGFPGFVLWLAVLGVAFVETPERINEQVPKNGQFLAVGVIIGNHSGQDFTLDNGAFGLTDGRHGGAHRRPIRN